jgi:immunity protein 8 of polymorphic toxin system
MKFEISSINIISSHQGNSKEDFWINLQVDVSAIDDHGAETFNVNVVGVDRLKSIVETEDLIGRGLIVSTNFNETRLRRMFENLLVKIKADNFDDLCLEFERYFDRI